MGHAVELRALDGGEGGVQRFEGSALAPAEGVDQRAGVTEPGIGHAEG